MTKEQCKKIESYEFAAIVNVASSFPIFLRTAYNEQVTKELIKQLEDPENLWLVLKRSVELSQREIDLQYENPWDTALTVYLWVLSLTKLEAAQTAAAFVRQAKNGWWSTKFANALLQNYKNNHIRKFDRSRIKFKSTQEISASQIKPELIISSKNAKPEEHKIARQPAFNWNHSQQKISVLNITRHPIVELSHK
ncbi:MAG: hypothetical protein H0X31_05265 [Nostocaceae cyanobacterium]|nr:hypothetical protein [Nostocaceae cyanobacterium]